MNFASTHIYRCPDSDEEFECVSDGEYEMGMTLSGGEEEEEEERDRSKAGSSSVAPPKPARAKLLVDKGGSGPAPPPPASTLGSRKKDEKEKPVSHWRRGVGATSHNTSSRKWHRADTNVVSINFNTLTSPCNMHTGDTVSCSNCQACLSKFSKLTNQGSDKVWKCEFCDEVNLLSDLLEEEIPVREDVTYMLQPAPATVASGRTGTDQTLVVFCVDTSGSMCVTTEVPGKINLRGTNRLQRLNSIHGEGESQFMPGQRQDITYISRLQSMQAAVDHQLEQMSKEHPDRRVALVSFNNEVTVIGDGTTDPVHISGDRLKDKDGLRKTGTELPQPASVKTSRQLLSKKVFELEEGGATALGPALYLSAAMASKYPGSKVIICTDGKANIGLGNLDNLDTDDQYQSTENFYSEVAQHAAEKGVSVSVISIKGADCKLVELGKVADQTGGQVNIVDPFKLTEQFGNILADSIIATNVTATLILHKGLYFRHEETSESKVVREVGNVTAETEVTFEFGVRKQQKKKKEENKEGTTAKESGVDKETDGAAGANSSHDQQPEGATLDSHLKELPFQLMIHYTDLEGMQAVRVLTQIKPITEDRQLAEQNINMPVIGVHTAQQTSIFAKDGRYADARMNAMTKQRLLSRASKSDALHRDGYEQFYDNIAPMERHLNVAQQRERKMYGKSRDSDNESDEETEAAGSGNTDNHHLPLEPRRKGILARLKKKKARTQECSDDTAECYYNARRTTSSAFFKKS